MKMISMRSMTKSHCDAGMFHRPTEQSSRRPPASFGPPSIPGRHTGIISAPQGVRKRQLNWPQQAWWRQLCLPPWCRSIRFFCS